MADVNDLKQYWHLNRNLTVIILGIWAMVSFGAIYFAESLNTVEVFGFPWGYYMGAQGSIVCFVALAVWYAKKMNKEAHKRGMHESE